LARFHYLHLGRIFNIEMGTASSASISATRRIEHFWLCERCAQTLKVVLENGIVATRPLRLNNAAQKKSEEKRNVA
jgi:hypothetical protein